MTSDDRHPRLSELFAQGKQTKLPKGQSVPVHDDRMHLNIVTEGYIKRYAITNDGAQTIQSVYGPGSIFPLTPAIKALLDHDIYKGPEVFYYESMTPTVVRSLTKETLLQAVGKENLIYKELLDVAASRLSSNIQRLENMALKAANRRVAHQLAYYADKFGKIYQDGSVELQIPLTHQNLAAILNLARETVTHCLTSLEKRGLIQTNKLIKVPDLDKLKQAIH